MLSPLPVAILAGGQATRLRPLTTRVPKSLLPVAGRPFIFHQLELLQSQGVEHVVLCVGHLGEQLRATVGDGATCGLRVSYSFDGAELLGTGGALRQALPLLGDEFFVMYGDSYLRCSLPAIQRSHHEAQRPALMTVLRNDNRWDRSNVLFGDGRVLAYDFKTGKRVWETTIADPQKNEVVPAAPIAWEGLVFIGNAGGDQKGAKGHMYALDAKTGKIVWEFFLVPKSEGDTLRGPQGTSPLDTSTWKNISGAPISGGGAWTSFSLDPTAGLLYVPVGNPAPDYDIGAREGENLFTDSVVVLDAKSGAYKNHFKIVRRDWHDWDVSNPPALIRTMGGKKLMAVSPKDGYLYGFDLADNKQLYRTPVTTIDNVDEPFSTDKEVHFCPGAGGGEEWNSPAYDPRTNLILTGDVDWCTTVKLQTREEIVATAAGQFWTGERSLNPFNEFGKFARADGHWAGWVHAVDADTGVWKWRVKTNYPIVSGVTPTAGGLVFFGDAGGNFYAIDSANGQKLWGQKIGGMIGGGVITYNVNGVQKVAVTTGMISPAWPVQITTAKVAILGVEGASR